MNKNSQISPCRYAGLAKLGLRYTSSAERMEKYSLPLSLISGKAIAPICSEEPITHFKVNLTNKF